MKPFDLEKALAGELVVTRDGLPVTQIKLFVLNYNNEMRVIAVVNHEEEQTINSFTKDGYFFDDKRECGFNLFMAPKKRTVWANLYKRDDGGHFFIGSVFCSENEATKNNNVDGYVFIKTLSTEIEE